MNRRLKRVVLDCNCAIIHGERRSGKSTLFALIIEEFKNAGYDVYCQYPYVGCKQIPLTKKMINGVVKYDVDKNFLYKADLSHSCVLIDEARTVWNARDTKNWTASDEEFFNLLGHNDTHIFMATQVYDCLDLNIRRAADYTFHLEKAAILKNFTKIEFSMSKVCKVMDRQIEVVGIFGGKGMQKVNYEVCEIPCGRFRFYRPPYYNKFITTYVFEDKPKIDCMNWEEIIEFPKKQIGKRRFFIFNDIVDKLQKGESDNAEETDSKNEL